MPLLIQGTHAFLSPTWEHPTWATRDSGSTPPSPLPCRYAPRVLPRKPAEWPAQDGSTKPGERQTRPNVRFMTPPRPPRPLNGGGVIVICR
jgi:hypothetical protein